MIPKTLANTGHGFPRLVATTRARSSQALIIGQIEQFIASWVKAVVPDQVQDFFSRIWKALRGYEIRTTGDDDITDHVEMIGWGVEEAQEEADKADASEFAARALHVAMAY